jgi:hypothetical protein
MISSQGDVEAGVSVITVVELAHGMSGPALKIAAYDANASSPASHWDHS